MRVRTARVCACSCAVILLVLSYIVLLHKPSPPLLVKPALIEYQSSTSESELRSHDSCSVVGQHRVPHVRVTNVVCTRLLTLNNTSAVDMTIREMAARINSTSTAESDVTLQDLVTHFNDSSYSFCHTFISSRCYVTQSLNDEEESYSIAFSILVYRDVVQFERLLRAIYRPSNIYCVHVDKSADPLIQKATRTLIACLRHNVFISSVQVDVTRAEFSVLEAELYCMEELLRRSKKWKYFINLTGQEFPLRTNLELVRIFKTFNESNNVDATIINRNMNRYGSLLASVPYNLTVTKGSTHIAVTRGFVDFAVNDHRALRFLNWVKRTVCPDETYFSTLNHNPSILPAPGAYTGLPESGQGDYRFVARHKIWESHKNSCQGKFVHQVCVFGVGDLGSLVSRPELFVNKFHSDFEPVAHTCLEEWFYNRTRDEVMTSNINLDLSLYQKLSHVNHHV